MHDLMALAIAEEEIRNEERELLEAFRKGTAPAPEVVRFGYDPVVLADRQRRPGR